MQKFVFLVLLVTLGSLSWSQESTNVDTQLASLTEQLKASQKRNAQLAVKLTDLESQLSTAQVQAENAADAESMVARLQTQLKARTSRVVELAVKVTDLESQLMSAQAETAPVEVTEDDGAMAALETQLQASKKRTAELAVKVTDLESQLSSMKVSMEAEPEASMDVTGDSDTLMADIDKLKNQLKARNARVAELAVRVTDLESQLSSAEANVEAATMNGDKATRLETQLNARNTRVAELAVRVTDLESQLTSAQAMVAITDNDDDADMAVLEDLEASNKRLLARNVQLAVQLTDMDSQMQSMQSLNDQIATLQEENQTLKLQLSEQQVTPVVSSTSTPTPSESRYIVQEGDTLSAIAEQVYGNNGLWPIIAEANGIALGEEADTISPGILLIIPAR